MLPRRLLSSGLLLLVWAGLLVPVFGQMSLSSTQGVLPPVTPTESLLLGDDLSVFQADWQQPRNSLQTTWRNAADTRASQSPSGTVPLDFSQAALDASIAQATALRWAMTGNLLDLQKAVDILLLAALPWGTSITRPEVLTQYLCAYDFLRGASFTDLPQSTRDQLESRLLGEARSLSSGNTDSNAKAKIGATRAMAGILLMDQALLDQGLQDLQNHLQYSTTDDGWFTDSPGHYLNYTLSHLGPFLRMYHQGSGVDLYPDFQPYVEMSLRLRRPDGRIPNLSNGLNSPVGLHLFSQSTVSGAAENILWQLFEGPPWGPLWTSTNLENNDGSYSRFFALTDFQTAPQSPSISPTVLASGQSGISVFRQSWQADSDWLLLSPGIDSPAGFLGIPAFHSHNDTLEILVASAGVPLLVAPGYHRDDLSQSPPGFDPQRADWHNVLLVDGDLGLLEKGRRMRPGDFQTGPGLDAQEQGGFRGAVDFRQVETNYGGVHVSRRILFPMERYFIAADLGLDFNANQHEFAVNWVGRGQFTAIQETPDHWIGEWLDQGQGLRVQTLGLHPLQFFHGDLHMHDTFNSFEATHRVKAASQGSAGAFLSFFEPFNGQAELSVQGLISAPGSLAAEIRSANEDWTDVLLFQGIAEANEAGNLASDGKVAWIREDQGEILHGFLSEGRQLAYQGELLFSADAELTISAQWLPQSWSATLAAEGIQAGTELRFYTFTGIQQARLNGQDLLHGETETYAWVELQGVSSGQANLLEIQHQGLAVRPFRTYGFGKSSNQRLSLVGEGPARPGTSATATVSGLTSANTWLAMAPSPGESPLVGGILLVDQNSATLYPPNSVQGEQADWVFQIPNDPGLVGTSFYLQAAGADFSLPEGWAFSHGLQLTIQP
ncbi:MAG: hypothetical protein DWQ01_22655 [Planctomycetota bacterium]|nr:MAG: hypothetical protein DWQ01_22655 [Planctomycetota bacterium]